MDNKIRKLALSGMFAALCCVATLIIRIPTVGTSGYINIGDTVVLLSGWILGGVYGPAAAGIGSMLADLLAGYPLYAPGTFVIKALMVVVSVAAFKTVRKAKLNLVTSYVLSSILGEIVMVAGYFIYEAALLGYGMAAAFSISGNAIQGITCLILGVALILAFEKSKELQKILKNG